MGVDAVTINPYLGMEANKPFLERSSKGIIALCRTSNPGADEFQDIEVKITEKMFEEIHQGVRGKRLEGYTMPKLMPMYQYVAWRVSNHRLWNKNDNCSVVVGATIPEQLAKVRNIVDDTTILIPGIGTQGGSVEKTVRAGIHSKNQGMIINAASSVIFASKGEDWQNAASREASQLDREIIGWVKEFAHA